MARTASSETNLNYLGSSTVIGGANLLIYNSDAGSTTRIGGTTYALPHDTSDNGSTAQSFSVGLLPVGSQIYIYSFLEIEGGSTTANHTTITTDAQAGTYGVGLLWVSFPYSTTQSPSGTTYRVVSYLSYPNAPVINASISGGGSIIAGSSNKITTSGSGTTDFTYDWFVWVNGTGTTSSGYISKNSTTLASTTYASTWMKNDNTVGDTISFRVSAYSPGYNVYSTTSVITYTVLKPTITLSPSGTTSVYEGTINALTWKASVSNVGSHTYQMHYLLGSTATTSGTFSTGTTSSTFILTDIGNPNDAATGYLSVYYTLTNSYGYSTTSNFSFVKVADTFTSAIYPGGVGLSATSGYYASINQYIVLAAFANFVSTTAEVAINLKANWAYRLGGVTSYTSINETSLIYVPQAIPAWIGSTVIYQLTLGNVLPGGTEYGTSSISIIYEEPVSVTVIPKSTTLSLAASGGTAIQTFTASTYGGGGSNNYSWYLNSVLQSANGDSYSFSTTIGGTYTLAAIVYNNTLQNTLSNTVIIDVLGYVNVELHPSSLTLLTGEEKSVSANVIGGVPPFSYTWSYYSDSTSTTSINTGSNAATIMFSTTLATPNGKLQCNVEDNIGHKGQYSIPIYIYTIPSISLSANPSDLVKSGTAVTVLSSTLGGSGNFNYFWSVNGSAMTSGNNSYVITKSTTGTYNINVVVFDTKTNYLAQNSIGITYYATIGATATLGYSTTVVGYGVGVSAHVSGGSPPYTYSWYGSTVDGFNSTVKFSTSAQSSFVPTSVAPYYIYVNVSDSSGNTANSNMAELTVVGVPSVNIGGSNVLVVNQLGNWTSSISGGSGNYSYRWYINGIAASTTATSSTFTHKFTEYGTYSLQLSVVDKGYRVQLYSNSYNVQVGAVISSTQFSDTVGITDIFDYSLSKTSFTPTGVNAFTCYINDKYVYFSSLQLSRTIDVSSELLLTITQKDMFNGATQVIRDGDPVQFYYLDKLVFSGAVQNIQKTSQMMYNITAYDELYYLSHIKLNRSVANNNTSLGQDFGNILGYAIAGAGVNYNVSTTGYSGFGFSFTGTTTAYFDLIQIASILGYKTVMSGDNLVLTKKRGGTTYSITENQNCIVKTKTTNSNYFYNAILVKANQNTDSGTAFTIGTAYGSTTEAKFLGIQNSVKTISAPWLYVREGLTWTNGGTSSVQELANMAAQLFPTGYNEVKMWYNVKSTGNYNFIALDNSQEFTVTFQDGTVWNNLICTEVYIDVNGVVLTLANFEGDIWSLLNTLTSSTP